MSPRRLLALLAVLFVTATAPAGHAQVIGRLGAGVDFAPQVRLISPVDTTVEISAGCGVECSWSRLEGDRMERRYYDFRIYRGYTMIEDTLLYTAHVAPDTGRICVDGSLFRDGEAYTWCVRQRYIGLAKSRRSYASFRVVKK